jgi:hypothetical protein
MPITPNEQTLYFNYKLLKILKDMDNDVAENIIINNLILAYNGYKFSRKVELIDTTGYKQFRRKKFYEIMEFRTQFIIKDYILALKSTIKTSQNGIKWQYL